VGGERRGAGSDRQVGLQVVMIIYTKTEHLSRSI
jgi:hypothetical protein